MKTISCLCLTHGRPYIVREAVESFRRQEPVKGVKTELIIVNDCPEQYLTCDVPGVMVYNLDAPIQDMSLKLNDSVMAWCGDWVAMWEDDDISLPHRLRLSWDCLCECGAKAIRQGRAWYWDKGDIVSRPENLFFGSALFERDYFLYCGGALSGDWMDKTAWSAIQMGGQAGAWKPTLDETHFVYRWGGLGTIHDSADGDSPMGKRATNRERHLRFRQKTLADKRFRPGKQAIVPSWDHDYTAQVRAAIADGRGEKI